MEPITQWKYGVKYRLEIHQMGALAGAPIFKATLKLSGAYANHRFWGESAVSELSALQLLHQRFFSDNLLDRRILNRIFGREI